MIEFIEYNVMMMHIIKTISSPSESSLTTDDLNTVHHNINNTFFLFIIQLSALTINMSQDQTMMPPPATARKSGEAAM